MGNDPNYNKDQMLRWVPHT